MKKRFSKTVTAAFLSIAMFLALTIAAFAIGIEFSASLSVGRRMYYVGDEVEFIVKVENTGNWDIDGIKVYNTRGSTPIASHGTLEEGDSVNIPVSKVFNSPGEFGAKFKVTCMREGNLETKETNTVNVTINTVPTPEPSPTPEPTEQPTEQPTEELTEQPTEEPAGEPELSEELEDEPEPTQTIEETSGPVEIAVSDNGEGGGMPTGDVSEIQSAEAERKNSSAWLYILLAAAGAVIIAAAVVITVLARKIKKNKKG